MSGRATWSASWPTLAMVAGLTAAPVLLGATAASASTTTIQLKDSQRGAKLADYKGSGECSGYSDTRNLWHFVVPDLSASGGSDDADIVSLSFNGTSYTAAADSDGGEAIQNGKGFNVHSSDSTLTT